MTHDELMNRGIAAARNGQRDAARQSFQQVLRHDPRHVQAWLWLSGVVDAPQQKRDCLQRVLALDPTNQMALQGMQQLAQNEAASFLATFEPHSPPAPAPTIEQPAPVIHQPVPAPAPAPAPAIEQPAPAPAPATEQPAPTAHQPAPEAAPEHGTIAPIPINLEVSSSPAPPAAPSAPVELPPVSQTSDAPCRFCGTLTAAEGECRTCGYEQIYDCPNCGRPLDLRDSVICECGQSLQQFLIDGGIDRERLGDVYFARDYPAAAVKQWKAALDKAARPAQLHRKIANVYLDLGLVEQARMHNDLSKQR